MHVKSLQSCLTQCNPVDCSLLGSSVHGISQVRILEWVAMLSSSTFRVVVATITVTIIKTISNSKHLLYCIFNILHCIKYIDLNLTYVDTATGPILQTEKLRSNYVPWLGS